MKTWNSVPDFQNSCGNKINVVTAYRSDAVKIKSFKVLSQVLRGKRDTSILYSDSVP
jgi:hypothetical protein